jgi:hypothetical protein
LAPASGAVVGVGLAVTSAACTISSADAIICALVIVAVDLVVVETKDDGCWWNNRLLNPALQLLVVPAARMEW